MPALKTAGSMYPASRIDVHRPSDTWTSHTARSVTRWGRCGAVISVEGELDAANAGQLADYVQLCAASCEWLVLDLDELQFVGTEGFSILKKIAARCAEADIYCTMVPGVVVARLLRICDPGNALPTTPSVAQALAGAEAFQQFR